MQFGAKPGSKLEVSTLVMNLESPDQVKNAVLNFLQQETRLDILINNAAMSVFTS
jgi:NAD(P)-dependent dehydrogenase (short-subunit alcohol dehydrogenase family)